MNYPWTAWRKQCALSWADDFSAAVEGCQNEKGDQGVKNQEIKKEDDIFFISIIF